MRCFTRTITCHADASRASRSRSCSATEEQDEETLGVDRRGLLKALDEDPERGRTVEHLAAENGETSREPLRAGS